MAGEVDVDVVRRVVGAVPGQFDALAADLERVGVGERHVRQRPGRVVVADEKPAGLLVPDPGDVVEQGGGPAVVGMVVGVDQMGHGVADALGGGDLVDSPAQVVADAGRCVEQDDAVACRQERRLVHPVGDPEQVPFDAPHVVSLLVQSRTERRTRNGRVLGQVVETASTGCGCCHDISLIARARHLRAVRGFTSHPDTPRAR